MKQTNKYEIEVNYPRKVKARSNANSTTYYPKSHSQIKSSVSKNVRASEENDTFASEMLKQRNSSVPYTPLTKDKEIEVGFLQHVYCDLHVLSALNGLREDVKKEVGTDIHYDWVFDLIEKWFPIINDEVNKE